MWVQVPHAVKWLGSSNRQNTGASHKMEFLSCGFKSHPDRHCQVWWFLATYNLISFVFLLFISHNFLKFLFNPKTTTLFLWCNGSTALFHGADASSILARNTTGGLIHFPPAPMRNRVMVTQWFHKPHISVQIRVPQPRVC